MTATLTDLDMSSIRDTSDPPKRRLPVLPVEALLRAQQTLTAVDRFARKHDAGDVPAQAKYYRDLIPLERPRPGEQYAFEVDLDACTGCKACVAACHTLNGLDDDEVWRTVGLLHGGTPAAPALQTVTTACHHCLEPACMLGCPVRAYEKDPVTGIVKHLDDQCFGCQYCTLMCPYDAPKYSKSRGIVRKCDMCSDRLAHGEAPGCVQACPNEAIAIRVVERAAAIEASDARTFLPGAPGPEDTLPTTVYKSKRAMPANMRPADFYRTSPEHAHYALVVMLTFTQLSVGAFGLGLLVERLSGRPAGSGLAQTAFALSLAVVALVASVFHLGRPWLAWRAVLGLRTSWLSREALMFGAFAGLAFLYGLMSAAPLILPGLPSLPAIAGAAGAVQIAAAVSGVLGVFFSVMVYVATKREQWASTHTGVRFFGSTIILGAALVLAVSALTAPGALAAGLSAPASLERVSRTLVLLVLIGTLVKLSFEGSLLLHARDRHHSAHKRVALVMLHDLQNATLARFALAGVGGVLLPLLVSGSRGGASLPATAAMVVLLVAGELTERYLFFRASPASRMPGGLP
jgi:Fe-S-cluster-containing dehydrogenase component/DMSO reductase anchor subunit